MGYRKTKAVFAKSEERRTAILQAMLDMIAKQGNWTTITFLQLAKHGGFAEGTVYNYFADKTEVATAAAAMKLTEHLVSLRSSGQLQEGLRAWAQVVASEYKLMSVIGTLPVYREGIKKELQVMLRRSGAESGALPAAVIYGAILEAARLLKPRDEAALVASLMRACGLRVHA